MKFLLASILAFSSSLAFADVYVGGSGSGTEISGGGGCDGESAGKIQAAYHPGRVAYQIAYCLTDTSVPTAVKATQQIVKQIQAKMNASSSDQLRLIYVGTCKDESALSVQTLESNSALAHQASEREIVLSIYQELNF